MAGTQMQLEDWLDDLCVRFIINLPQEDLSSVARICFQVEEAQWFYEDFIRPLDPTLPSMSLRTFCLRIFQHCPLLASFSVENHTKAFEQFLEYKTRVPVRGAIMLNEAMDSTVLVKGWKKGANWSFPRGKINKDEDDLDCAIREVYEETGLDLRAAGLVPTEGKPKYIEISMREQHMRLYVFRDVPMDTKFEPKTRKEISKIQWYKLSELPAFRKKGGQNQDTPAVPNANKFYMVAPFLVPLKKWVVQLKKTEAKRAASGAYSHLHPPKAIDEVVTEDDMWTQTDTGAESSRTPAIDTLVGATQELQRLLKVQAPTQGLQHPPPKDDKGSALLSILQAKGPGPPPISQPGLVHPHTPLDLTLRELIQPRTPHHHIHHHAPTVNTQQPPPSFPFAPSQAAAWNPAMQALQTMPPPHTFSAVPQVHGGNQAQLVHPQPFPPEVQGPTFTRGEFQDWSQNRSLPLLGQYPQQSPDFGSVQPPPQASMSAGNGRSGHLSSQSMALLNAFKGNAPPHGAEENFNQVQPVMPGDRQVPLPPHGPTGLAQIQTGLELTGPSNSQAPPPVSPQELAGSRVGPPGGDHRSALLGMFRKADPKSGAEHTAQQGKTYAPGPNTVMPARGPSIGAVDGKMPQLLDSLSLNHPGGPVAQIQTTRAPQNPVQALAPAGPRPQPTQPIRILQRGQSDIPLGANRQVLVSPQVSPQELVGQPVPGHFANSPSITAVPMPGGLAQRPQSGQQQRQQLLSLFGKQKQPSPIGFEIGKGKEVAAEAPRSRMPSIASGTAELASSSSPSHRDSQTPISSADHSFLLGYLESVTNSAAR